MIERNIKKRNPSIIDQTNILIQTKKNNTQYIHTFADDKFAACMYIATFFLEMLRKTQVSTCMCIAHVHILLL